MIPKALRIVAMIHLMEGLISVARIVVNLTQGSIAVDFGLLGIPICFGLLRLSNGWRDCALLFLWLGILQNTIALFTLAYGLRSGLPAQLHIIGIPVVSMSPIGPVVSFFRILLNVWQYRVLTRGDIKARFLRPTRNVFDPV